MHVDGDEWPPRGDLLVVVHTSDLRYDDRQTVNDRLHSTSLCYFLLFANRRRAKEEEGREGEILI